LWGKLQSGIGINLLEVLGYDLAPDALYRRFPLQFPGYQVDHILLELIKFRR
jgi:hypothetical protein